MKKIVVFLLACLLLVFAAPIYAQVLNPANGHYYELIQNTATWYTARDTAAGMSYNGLQGHLATITSQGENAFVLNTWPELGYSAEVWIGGSDEASEGNWQWLTNEPWAYTYWNGGEPNNADGGENCLDYKYAGWNDSPCDAQFWYLVEYEPAICTPPPSGMVAWWAGDDNAFDRSGAYDGTLMNGSTFAPGKVGQAFSFDGVNDYVDLPDGFANFTSGFTVDLWANPTASTYWARFIDFGNGPANNNIVFARETTTNNLVFEVYNGASSTGKVHAFDAITNDEWHYYAVTQDETGQVKIYKDGLPLVTTGTTGVPNNVTRVNNHIGKSDWGGDGYYAGTMDEVEIFNRALSADEIAAIYNAGSAGKCMAPSLTVNIDMPTGGTVKGGGINCPAGECSMEYKPGTAVILTATPKNSYKFRGWTGCDTVLKSRCTMHMTEDKNVTANFTGIYNISGKVVNHVGAPMTNVTVTLESVAGGGGEGCGNQCDIAAEAIAAAEISRLVVTDAYGKYKFSQLPNGNYKVTPGKIGFTFTPLNQKVQILDSHASGVNFKLVY
ncbi:MAG: carboxypeptidase regulatory-like domain-containing protein [Nitrospirae bacterium]|nr:carboxypeptidase regulatory-like domain-containing protein [Nitrospirota bacterium]